MDNSKKIALLTPTGGRLKQIQLCEKWMSRQTYTGNVLWIIVDDCMPKTITEINNFKDNWEVIKLYPEKKWIPGQNTQGLNLLFAIDELKKHKGIEYVFIIEDDDYYFSEYLEKMILQIKGYDAAGQTNTVYYNILNNSMKRCPNKKHGSLFQTAFCIQKLNMFIEVLKSGKNKFIDINFWRMLQQEKTRINLFGNNDLSIGIKGLPGRKGIGGAHISRPNWKKQSLKKLIGADYINYIK